MNIAILIGEIAYISHSSLLNGIREQANKYGDNILLFTCEGFLYQHLDEYIKGEYTIFDLLSMDQCDGIIADFSSIVDVEVRQKLMKRVEESGVPCVSYNLACKNADVVSFDNISGLKDLIIHLITEHNAKHFVYLSGPESNSDAIERKNVFFETLASKDIEMSEDDVYYGDFNYISGRTFVREYMKEQKTMPDAIVVANDFMAIGAVSELKQQGFRVPEDVIVTGYDNVSIVNQIDPPLTTVDRREYEAGVRGYDLLKQKIERHIPAEEHITKSRFVCNASCGCNLAHKRNEEQLVQDYLDLSVSNDGDLDMLKTLSIEFSNIERTSDLSKSMEQIIPRLDLEFFYFCQCGSRESYYEELEQEASGASLNRDVTTYSPTCWCPIAYEKGRWRSYGTFPTKELFPTNSRYEKESGYYVIMPVHQKNRCLGYSIIGNYSKRMSGRVFQHLVLFIDQAIGNKRKSDLMLTMLARINEKWQYDELTKLYNRSGMRHKAEIMIREAQQAHQSVAVYFLDLNGLKRVNDEQGHAAGDCYIKAMADMLTASCDENDIVVRYGGDEFIVISMVDSEVAAKSKMKRLEESIVEPVSSSFGYVCDKPKDMEMLNQMISRADALMYEDKVNKHRER